MSTDTDTPTDDAPTDDHAGIDGDTLDALAHDLRGAIGQDNAITSGELAEAHFPDDGDANPTTREAVKILMRTRNLPVIGGSTGYYIPRSQAPIDDAIASLEGRIEGIRERQRLLAENWSDWNRDADDADAILSKHEREQVEADPVLSVEDVLEHRGADE